MAYHFRNLIFEGGGVKGIAYVGAMDVLKQKEILGGIKRVGGTSAGAINALLLALGYDNDEQLSIMNSTDFNDFMDDSFGIIRDMNRLVEKFGWNKGDFFHEWITKLIKKKLKDGNATFQDLKDADGLDLYVYGTNLSTSFGEVFSIEHTPKVRLADAVRISMSIPLFFAAIRNARNDVYVDGGVLNNYPIKLFDRRKYLLEADATQGRNTSYYDEENVAYLADAADGNNPKEYIFNRETLGFRLDSAQEIAAFRYGNVEKRFEIEDFFDFAKALITTVVDSQQNNHLHGDDWARTVYIDSLGVGTTDFDLDNDTKEALVSSGTESAKKYFAWYDGALQHATEEEGRPPNASLLLPVRQCGEALRD